ncbi:hypothetical protein FACS1894145_5500 [Bacteroidia bacterium]|nr:hypothetical protein FACS1894145_5500 [Bacteroidia bacterium]
MEMAVEIKPGIIDFSKGIFRIFVNLFKLKKLDYEDKDFFNLFVILGINMWSSGSKN